MKVWTIQKVRIARYPTTGSYIGYSETGGYPVRNKTLVWLVVGVVGECGERVGRLSGLVCWVPAGRGTVWGKPTLSY